MQLQIRKAIELASGVVWFGKSQARIVAIVVFASAVFSASGGVSAESNAKSVVEPQTAQKTSQPSARTSDAAIASGESRGRANTGSAGVENAISEDDSLGKRYYEAELVAQVQISGVHRLIDNALSEPGMVAILGYVYSAVSQQVWKGEANKLIAFRLGLNACDKKLKRGEKYLIFATTDSLGRLQLAGCDSVVPETEVAPLLAKLNQFYQQG
jgi:hypothetical protein